MSFTGIGKSPVDQTAPPYAAGLSSGVYDYWGVGAPGTVLANANVGSTYRQLDGASGSMMWQKTTAGWEQLQTSGWSQALADTLYLKISGGTLTGALGGTTASFTGLVASTTSSVRAGGPGSIGYVQLTSGSAGNIGYIEFYTASSVRQGYIGFGASNINMTLENSASFVITGGATDFNNGQGSIKLLNATSNWIEWNPVGVAAPAFTTRSSGVHLLIYPALSTTSADYAIGIENAALWFGTPTTAESFKWYGGTALAAQLFSTGAFNVANAITLLNRTTGSATDIAIASGPTGNTQIALGGNSVWGAIGQMYSSGNSFLTYNANIPTKNVDSWAQSNAALASARIQITPAGLDLHGAVVGKATATNATFWGTATVSLSAVNGNINMLGQLRVGNQSGANGLTGDVIAARSTTQGAYYFGNSTTTYIYYDGTVFNFSGGALNINSNGISATSYTMQGGTASGSIINGSVSTYGSLNVVGISSGYAGIRFQSLTTTFMFSGSGGVVGGMYDDTTGWYWYLSDGADIALRTTLHHKQQYFHLTCLTLQTTGGIQFTDNAMVGKGFVYWESGGFGLLDQSASWRVRVNTSGGNLYGAWDCNSTLTQNSVNVAKIQWGGGAPTGTPASGVGTIYFQTS